MYACQQCGREDSQWGRRCSLCVLAEGATALLSEPDGGIHPRLQPLYDTLLAGPRPQTTLYWFDRSTGPDLLRSMAQGQVEEISHATFESLPTNKTNNYLRNLLAATGVLPPFHAELERVTPWLRDITADLPQEHAELLTQFARWQVLRRLRHHEQAGPLTHGAISAARATVVATTRFMAWQHKHGRSVAARAILPTPPRPCADADPVPDLGPRTPPHPPRAEPAATAQHPTGRHPVDRQAGSVLSRR